MNAWNPTSFNRCVYWITDPGIRLAAYLDYCQQHPTRSPDLAFANLPAPVQPEHHDIENTEASDAD